MTWGFPSALFALWLVPLIGLLVARAHSRRQQAVSRFVQPDMAKRLLTANEASPWRRAMLLMAALLFLILALARPRFGEYFDEVSSRGVDVFVALDVSRSMMAEDVRPNRLDRAKSDVLDLLERLEGDRVGLIVFAGAPVVQVPLTTDQPFFRTMLSDVDPASAPRGGTMIGDAIRKALSSMEPRADRDQAIVLITDGGDQDSFPREAAEHAAARGVKIITVGLGDSGEGARIPSRGANGRLGFVQHEGQEVWSKMDESLLEQIANTTQGAYVPARTLSYDLGQIYDDHLSKLTQGDMHTEKRRHLHERFQWFGAIGVMFFALEWLLPVRRRPAEVRSESEAGE